MRMRITVVGAGCVGVATAAAFATWGHDTTCADIDEERIRALSGGRVPFHEPGLGGLVARGRENGPLRFETEVGAAIRGADVVFAAVGGGAAAVVALSEVVIAAGAPALLVIKSTVAVGTGEAVARRFAAAGVRVDVASNPEFLREGSAVDDVLRPDRIVVGIGPHTDRARAILEELYRPLRDRILWMDPASAELTKVAANVMLATRISYMNEIALLCERVGADVRLVRDGIGSDPRIGPHMLNAGAGYGGSCLPADVVALVDEGRRHGVDLLIAAATHEANLRQRDLLLRKLERSFDGDLRGRKVAVWGVAFKPGTDDLREAPALDLIEALLAAGTEVSVHDPAAGKALRRRLGDRITVVDSELDAAAGADALVLVTEWPDYARPDLDVLARTMRRRFVLDGRNLWADLDLRGRGFLYEGIGVPA